MSDVSFEEFMDVAIDIFLTEQNVLSKKKRKEYYSKLLGYATFAKNKNSKHKPKDTLRNLIQKEIQDIDEYCSSNIDANYKEEYSVLFLKFFAFITDIVNRQKFV